VPGRHAVLIAVVLLLAGVLPVGADPGVAEVEAALRVRLEGLLESSGPAAVLAETGTILGDRPDSVAAWEFRAFSLQKLGRHSEACLAYEKVLALNPGSAWASMHLGDVLSALGRHEEAALAVERAVEMDPKNATAHIKLSWVLRRARAFQDAVVAAERAMVFGVDPRWCHSELAYLCWVLGEAGESRAHWQRARELGLDEAAYRQGMRLLRWDEQVGAKADGSPADGLPTVYRIGCIEVHTRIAPRLPAELTALIRRLEQDFARFLDLPPEPDRTVRLVLSRTLEEHEAFRSAQFPQGPVDRGFLLRRMVGNGPRQAPRWELVLHVALPAPGLELSLSHELAHAMLQLRIQRCAQAASWLDEGVATWLEIRSSDESTGSGSLRTDLLDILRRARSEGTTLSFRGMLRLPPGEFQGPFARERYAQAWSMIHFLIEGTGTGGRARFLRFLDAVDESRGAYERALDRIYGLSGDELDAAWRRHLDTLL
jgi:tetratricopeptide (TPR) repeat protein